MDEEILGLIAVVVVGAVLLGVSLLSTPGVDIEAPLPNEVLTNPVRVVISGLPGGAEVGVRLRDALGRVLVEKALTFRGGRRAEGLLYFDLPTAPSGHMEVFSLAGGRLLERIPVRFVGERGTWVKVFFLDSQGNLFPAVRRIAETPRVATETIRALLSGPTLPEERAGLWTAAPTGARLRAISISNGTARVILAVPDPNAPTLALFSSQLERTLTQFSTISKVEFRFVRS